MRFSDTGFVMHRGVIARSMIWVRLIQFVNVVFGVAYVFLGARFVMEYARLEGPSLAFLRRVTEPLALPLARWVPTSSDPAGHPFVWSLALTALGLAVVHVMLRALLRLSSRPAHDDEV